MRFKMNNNNWKIKEITNEQMNKLTNSDARECFTHGTTQYNDNTIYINKETPEKRKTLYHELMHCFLYEYGHKQWNKEFDNEDICEISSSSHDLIHKITNDYFKSVI